MHARRQLLNVDRPITCCPIRLTSVASLTAEQAAQRLSTAGAGDHVPLCAVHGGGGHAADMSHRCLSVCRRSVGG